MTLVDTLDALTLLNKPATLDAALQALRNLTWDIDRRVHVFELTIRCAFSLNNSKQQQ